MLIVELISYVTPQQLIHLHFSPDTVIAPIPLHIKKEGERGYNQSQLLADVLSVLTKTPQANLLRRTRYTNSQTTLKTAKERHHNVLGAFEITDKGMSTIRGRRVILVDDVITTGSTMREAANAIRYGDPRQIVGFSLTHE
jgi:ComF family protein